MNKKVKLKVDAMSKEEQQKRLEELNEKFGITHARVEPPPQGTLDDSEEREYLKKKLGYSNASE